MRKVILVMVISVFVSKALSYTADDTELRRRYNETTGRELENERLESIRSSAPFIWENKTKR